MKTQLAKVMESYVIYYDVVYRMLFPNDCVPLESFFSWFLSSINCYPNHVDVVPLNWVATLEN